MQYFIAFLKDEDGQTSTEYILLVAVVALIVFKFKSTALEQLNKITDSVFGNANKFVDQLGDASAN